MAGTILVTGGADYIGSHFVRQLGERGKRVVTLDDLFTGNRAAVLYGDLVVGSVGDSRLVQSLLRDYGVEAVLHFAASTVVPESVEQPLAYYRNDTLAIHTLLEACADCGVNAVIFSSTAAMYGLPEAVPVGEDAPTRPINPYGSSQLASEWMIHELAQASDLRHVTLRYFNVAGCDPEGRIGQSTPDAHLLIKVASEVALGKRRHLAINGTDYPTRDGTGVRDYIHVEDLADAHLRALDHLRSGRGRIPNPERGLRPWRYCPRGSGNGRTDPRPIATRPGGRAKIRRIPPPLSPGPTKSGRFWAGSPITMTSAPLWTGNSV